MVPTFKVKIQFVSLCGFIKYKKAFLFYQGSLLMEKQGSAEAFHRRVTSKLCGKFLISPSKVLETF